MLLRHCPDCGIYCGDSAIVVGHGVDAELNIDCGKCGRIVTWSTQPEISNISSCDLHKGNLDTAAAVLLGGSTYEDLDSIASNLNLKIMAKPTFYE